MYSPRLESPGYLIISPWLGTHPSARFRIRWLYRLAFFLTRYTGLGQCECVWVCVCVHIGVNQRTVKKRESVTGSEATDRGGEMPKGQSVRCRRQSVIKDVPLGKDIQKSMSVTTQRYNDCLWEQTCVDERVDRPRSFFGFFFWLKDFVAKDHISLQKH